MRLPAEVQRQLLRFAESPPVLLRSLTGLCDRLAAMETDELSRLAGLERYFIQHLTGSAETLGAAEAFVRLCVAAWMARRGEPDGDLELLLELLEAQFASGEESDLFG